MKDKVNTTIEIEGIVIDVQRKKMKNMNVRVCAPEGKVKISAPLRSSDAFIRQFALSHIAWIQKHQLAYKETLTSVVNNLSTGERHYLQGREYILRVHERIGKSGIQIVDDTFIDLYVPYGSKTEQREKTLMQGYRDLMKVQLVKLVPAWERIIGVGAAQYQIRAMKSRWGSCQPHTRKITLNLQLMKYPVECLIYVLVHELVHLLETSHNARFKSLMDRFLPDWREYKAKLEVSVMG